MHVKRKVLVVLLNGKKLEITCDASTITFADVFQVSKAHFQVAWLYGIVWFFLMEKSQ